MDGVVNWFLTRSIYFHAKDVLLFVKNILEILFIFVSLLKYNILVKASDVPHLDRIVLRYNVLAVQVSVKSPSSWSLVIAHELLPSRLLILTHREFYNAAPPHQILLVIEYFRCQLAWLLQRKWHNALFERRTMIYGLLMRNRGGLIYRRACLLLKKLLAISSCR